MATVDIPDLARRAHAKREQDQAIAHAEYLKEQVKLGAELAQQSRASWNEEVALVLFKASNDVRVKELEWHPLEDQNTDWELKRNRSGIEANQKTTGKPSRWFLYGANAGAGVTLVIKLDIASLEQRQNELFARVDDGPVSQVKDLADLGAIIDSAQN